MSSVHDLMFKSEMVLAYLDNRKDQTRRTRGLDEINKNPGNWEFKGILQEGALFTSHMHVYDKIVVKPPYGKIGDLLFFRETWKMWERPKDGKDFLHYRADDAKVDPVWWPEKEWTRPDPVWAGKFDRWQPSMLMPRICSRFRNIPILDVRIERLHDLTNDEAINEGWDMDVYKHPTALRWYEALWDKINGKTLPWSSNPYVWVYRFPKYNAEP